MFQIGGSVLGSVVPRATTMFNVHMAAKSRQDAFPVLNWYGKTVPRATPMFDVHTAATPPRNRVDYGTARKQAYATIKVTCFNDK